jgi:hypothetical protein
MKWSMRLFTKRSSWETETLRQHLSTMTWHDWMTPCVVLYSSQVSTFSLFLYIKILKLLDPWLISSSCFPDRHESVLEPSTVLHFLLCLGYLPICWFIGSYFFFYWNCYNIHLTLLDDLLFIFCSDRSSILLLVVYYNLFDRLGLDLELFGQFNMYSVMKPHKSSFKNHKCLIN